MRLDLRQDQIATCNATRASMDIAGGVLSDEQALDAPLVFRPWVVGETVKSGDVRRVDIVLYRCVLSHTTQADWEPSATPNLWTRITKPDEWPAWTKGSWAKGAQVTHKDNRWISQVDNNTWEPGAPGVYDNIWKSV